MPETIRLSKRAHTGSAKHVARSKTGAGDPSALPSALAPTCMVVQSKTSSDLEEHTRALQDIPLHVFLLMVQLVCSTPKVTYRLEPARRANGERKQLMAEKSLIVCNAGSQRK